MSACEIAEQHVPEGGVGFGGVTDGLHAIKPSLDMLHICPFTKILPSITMVTVNKATNILSFLNVSILSSSLSLSLGIA